MSDIELQRALNQFSADPSRETLVRYLILLERNQLLSEGYLVDILMEYPFGRRMWPWFYGGEDDLGERSRSRYQKTIHQSMLRLIARIQPREVLFDILLKWEPLQQFIQVIHIIWKWLLNKVVTQYGDIVDRYDFESKIEAEIRKAALAREHGIFLPEILWLDWEKPWQWSSWGQYPEDSDPIATAIFDGNWKQPETVTKAFRCAVDTNLEPTAGCRWIERWKLPTGTGDLQKFPRWVEDVMYLRSNNYGSGILIPYHPYCHTHQLDFSPIKIVDKLVLACLACHEEIDELFDRY